MVALLLFIAFGLLFGFFATQNTALVSVRFGNSLLEFVPLYVLVLVSFGIGVFFASLFYTVKFLGSRFALGKKEHEVSRAEKEIADLTKNVHKLELENAQLKGKTGENLEEDDEHSL